MGLYDDCQYLDSFVRDLRNRVNEQYSSLCPRSGLNDGVLETPPPFYKGGINEFRRDLRFAKLFEYVSQNSPTKEEILNFMLRIGMCHSEQVQTDKILHHEIESSEDFKTVLGWVHAIQKAQEDEQALAEAEKRLAEMKKELNRQARRALGIGEFEVEKDPQKNGEEDPIL